jgi:AmiR/NasT family two-component response regulator
MAREAGIELDLIDEDEGQIWYITTEGIKAFEALVRADERAANIACIGRIAAMVVDPIDQARLYQAMDSIRARGNT